MSQEISISRVAIVFTDDLTGQGYMRTLNQFEANLVIAQLTALDDGELKAQPVYPTEIRKMSPIDITYEY